MPLWPSSTGLYATRQLENCNRWKYMAYSCMPIDVCVGNEIGKNFLLVKISGYAVFITHIRHKMYDAQVSAMQSLQTCPKTHSQISMLHTETLGERALEHVCQATVSTHLIQYLLLVLIIFSSSFNIFLSLSGTVWLQHSATAPGLSLWVWLQGLRQSWSTLPQAEGLCQCSPGLHGGREVH